MVTDRVSNAAILAILAVLFPSWGWAFFLDIILDISSHWYQMYATLLGGETHHKTAVTDWKLLHYYYHNYNFLCILIGGNEVENY
jgi:CDP-diacylglycerol--inositol 3-phosphatidyltransferase